MNLLKTRLFLVLIPFFWSLSFAQCIDSSLISPNIICPTVIDPVCGCDQITYDNSCVATYVFGVSSYMDGPCNPVSSCNSGFQTSGGNGCSLEFYGYGADSYEWEFQGSNIIESGNVVSHTFPGDGTYWVLLLAYDGQNQLCDSIYQFVTVIGCDDLLCIDPSSIDSSFICTEQIEPVCGCDGITYNNACEAENWFGVTEWTNGPCNNSGECEAGFQFSFDGNCSYTFYAFGAEDYEWWFDDMVFIGASVTLYISPNQIQDICMYAYDAEGVLCDTVCQSLLCNLASLDKIARLPLTVYPNPSINGRFIIAYDDVLDTASLFDLYGRPIDCPVDLATGLVDGSELNAGKYFLSIRTKDKSYFEQIVIIK